MKNIPANSLISTYLPADYADSYSREVTCNKPINPEEFRNLAFNQYPKWIEWLMNARNAIVKPLGLDTEGRFMDMICARNNNEEIFGMPDKHLTFHVSVWCGEYNAGKQELRISTVVKYNNRLGKVYFFFIHPFHAIIVQYILKDIDKKLKRRL